MPEKNTEEEAVPSTGNYFPPDEKLVHFPQCDAKQNALTEVVHHLSSNRLHMKRIFELLGPHCCFSVWETLKGKNPSAPKITITESSVTIPECSCRMKFYHFMHTVNVGNAELQKRYFAHKSFPRYMYHTDMNLPKLNCRVVLGNTDIADVPKYQVTPGPELSGARRA